MTDTEIDKLEGPALDTAIAEAMEPNPPTPDKWGPRYSPAGWWKCGFASHLPDVASWFAARASIYAAVDLLNQIEEWGWKFHAFKFQNWEVSAQKHGDGEINCAAPTFPLAVARLFFRISESRKTPATPAERQS
jgi:hypothetical protein